jgi:hypothetical protein
MAISTMDALIAALTASTAQLKALVKRVSLTTAAGGVHSLWTCSGVPTAGSAPGAAATCTSATTGAVTFTDPGGSNVLYLARLAVMAGNPGASLTLYDRLVHSSGLDGTSTSSQTVNTPTFPNRGGTTGEGVEAFVECYSDLGATSRTLTVTYTDNDGNTGQTTTVTIPSTLRAGRILPIIPAAGDKGFRSIESVQLNLSTGTAGNFGVTLARRIAFMPVGRPGVGVAFDGISLGLPRIYAGACLWFVAHTTATTMGDVFPTLTLAEG